MYVRMYMRACAYIRVYFSKGSYSVSACKSLCFSRGFRLKKRNQLFCHCHVLFILTENKRFFFHEIPDHNRG